MKEERFDTFLYEDYGFKNPRHVMNFLSHLFIISLDKSPQFAFKAITGGIYVNGKSFQLEGNESIDKRRNAYNMAVGSEINFDQVCKSFLVLFKGEMPTYEDFIKLCKQTSEVIKEHPNITYFCASTHLYQWYREPHYHFFYTCKEDIKNELQDAIVEYINK